MGLLDEIGAEQRTPTARCGVAAVLDSLTPDEADDLRAALANRERYSASGISRAIEKRHSPSCSDAGCSDHIRLAADTIRRHRLRGCVCP